MCTVQRILTNVYSHVITTTFKIRNISITSKNSKSSLRLPFLKCLFSNNYRLTRSCKNSTERSHVPFTQLSLELTSYITIAQYQSQWNNMSAIPLAGLYPFWFHEIFHALICVCMLVCTVLCDFITCMVLHNHHHKGTPWSYSFRVTPILSPLPSLISGSH